MNHCRNCWAETNGLRLCGKCLLHLNKTLTQAETLLQLITDDIGKQAVKAPTGGGGDSNKPPINLAALDKADQLRAAVTQLQIDAHSRADSNPATLKSYTARLQKPARWNAENDPLREHILSLEEAVKACTVIVDVRDEKIIAGTCPRCGGVLRRWATHTGAVVCYQCRHICTPEEARGDMQERIKDSLDGEWFKDAEMVAAIQSIGYHLTEPILRQWVKRGKLTRGEDRKLLFDDVLEQVEKRDIRRS